MSEGKSEQPQIPPHARPVEFMLAEHEGREYVSFPTIEEARRHPHGVMIMQADWGGQILLTCPAARVRADEASLKRLLVDLEWITWGPGIPPGDPGEPDGAAIYFEPLPPGSAVGGGMGGGAVTGGLWLHPELEELALRGPIADVLDGRSRRMPLAAGFPDDEELTSINEARRYPTARLRMISGLTGQTFVDAPASVVRATDAALHRLLQDLEARAKELGRWAWVPNPGPPRLYFTRRTTGRLDPEIRIGGFGDQFRIRQILAGEVDRL